MFLVTDYTVIPERLMATNDIKDARDMVIDITGSEKEGDTAEAHMGSMGVGEAMWGWTAAANSNPNYGIRCFQEPDFDASEVFVCFSFVNDDGVSFVRQDICLDELYADWYGDCDLCPSNDTFITGIELRTKNGAEWSIVNKEQEMKFGDFMDLLEVCFNLKTPKPET